MEHANIVEIIGLIIVPLALAISGAMAGAARASKRAIKEKEEALEALREKHAAEILRENDEEHKHLRQTILELQGAIDRLNRAMVDMQVDFAERYATSIAVTNIEKRLGEGLTRLENKLDKVLLANR